MNPRKYVITDVINIIAIGGAEDRNRTGTVVSNRRILSPLRLPVPPPRQYQIAD